MTYRVRYEMPNGAVFHKDFLDELKARDFTHDLRDALVWKYEIITC